MPNTYKDKLLTVDSTTVNSTLSTANSKQSTVLTCVVNGRSHSTSTDSISEDDVFVINNKIEETSSGNAPCKPTAVSVEKQSDGKSKRKKRKGRGSGSGRKGSGSGSDGENTSKGKSKKGKGNEKEVVSKIFH